MSDLNDSGHGIRGTTDSTSLRKGKLGPTPAALKGNLGYVRISRAPRTYISDLATSHHDTASGSELAIRSQLLS